MAPHPDLPRDTLLALCAGELSSDQIQSLKSLSTEDWSWIERRAKAYRLLPTLGSIFASHDDWPVPRPLREGSRDALRQSAFRSLVMQRALIEIGELFDAHRIAYCALKGASLSLEFYAEPALRPMRDLDIMVAPDQAEKAYEHLLEAGYTKLQGKGHYGMEYAHHLPPLTNADGVLLELHHRIAPREWSGSLPLGQRLLLNARPIEFQGHLVRMAHPTDTFLHLVVHASFQHLFDNGPCLLSDVSALERSGLVDHASAQSFADEHGLTPSLELIRAMSIRYGKSEANRVGTHSRVPETILDQTAKLMTQDPEQHWQRFLLRKRRSVAKRIFEGLARAFRPTEKDLAEIAQRDVTGLEAWRYYPAWLSKRTSVYLRVEFQKGLDSEAASDAELERWLGRPS
ncbi:MAG: nucleotidyltransferase family protein [Pseudomonadota bacterium]